MWMGVVISPAFNYRCNVVFNVKKIVKMTDPNSVLIFFCILMGAMDVHRKGPCLISILKF